MHFLKKQQGVVYVWGLLHDGVRHDVDNCTSLVWNNDCRGASSRHGASRAWGRKRRKELEPGA